MMSSLMLVPFEPVSSGIIMCLISACLVGILENVWAPLFVGHACRSGCCSPSIEWHRVAAFATFMPLLARISRRPGLSTAFLRGLENV
eukprot:3183828-Pyramimonas_sp.AAC.1